MLGPTDRNVPPPSIMRLAAPRCALLGLLFLILALCGAELVFGSWFPPNFGPLELEPNERRFYDVTRLYPGGGVVEFRTDRYGFRGRYGNNPSEIDLLLIGNSTVREEYVEEHETWANRLQQRFSADGRTIAIAVAADHGMTTRGLLRRFDDWLAAVPGLRARYVLAYIGSNEMNPAGSDKYDRMTPESGMGRAVAYAKNASILYAAYSAVRARLRRASSPTPIGSGRPHVKERWVDAGPLPLVASGSERPSTALAAYEDRVRRLAERIRRFGAIPIIANQHLGYYRIAGGRILAPPNAPATAAQDAYAEARRVGDAAMRACRTAGALCVDTVAEFAYDDPADLYDHVHTTPGGDRKLADFLYVRLKDTIAAP